MKKKGVCNARVSPTTQIFYFESKTISHEKKMQDILNMAYI